MTNEEDSGGGGSGEGKHGNDALTALLPASSTATDGQVDDGGAGAFPNGDVGFSNGNGGVGSTGTASDECSDHAPLETDALQPKMVNSKSANRIKESKEVRIIFCLCPNDWSIYTYKVNMNILRMTDAIIGAAYDGGLVDTGITSRNVESEG